LLSDFKKDEFLNSFLILFSLFLDSGDNIIIISYYRKSDWLAPLGKLLPKIMPFRSLEIVVLEKDCDLG
jgi:hypothetical protein